MRENSFLLDTHVFIWWMEKSKKLSNRSYDLINNPKNQIFLSVATVWEMVIKKSKKKLKLTKAIEVGIKTSRFTSLPIETAHVLGVEKLPLHHKDPFDRILISQAKVENLTLISSDQKIWKYNPPLIKA